jgi:putative membrane protein
MKLSTRLSTACLVVLMAGGWVLAHGGADSALNGDDSDFLKKAAEGGMAEVELGKLALQKASSPDVKEFADMMIRDHTKANRELTALAASKGLKLPAGKGLGEDVSAAHLKMLSGKSFDDAYVKNMVEDHKEDVADFQKESESAQDTDVRKFAGKTLPTLKTHLSKIEKIQAAM